MRRWLHAHGIHHFCRRKVVTVRERTGTDYDPEWLTYKDPTTGEVGKLDVTVFGGKPTYQTVNREMHW